MAHGRTYADDEIVCEACGREFKTVKSLKLHESTVAARPEAPVLSSAYPCFRWHLVEVRPGELDTPCWIWVGKVPPTARTVSVLGEVKELFTRAVGSRGTGEMWSHLCERYGEPNLCVNPDHVVIGTMSSNIQHRHDLRRAAGIKHPGPSDKRGHYFTRKRCEALMQIMASWGGYHLED